MHALDRRKLPYPSRGKPVEELDGGARIGAAGVRIADIGGEEFKEAIGRALADGGDKGGGAVGGDGCELVILPISFPAPSRASLSLALIFR